MSGCSLILTLLYTYCSPEPRSRYRLLGRIAAEDRKSSGEQLALQIRCGTRVKRITVGVEFHYLAFLVSTPSIRNLRDHPAIPCRIFDRRTARACVLFYDVVGKELQLRTLPISNDTGSLSDRERVDER